jgi:peptide deformylase
MIETMHAAPGVGLAAPQVGESLRVFVMGDDPALLETMSAARLEELGRRPLSLHTILNPSLESLSQEKAIFFEGCLSIPGYSALVPRWQRVRLTGLDAQGETLSMDLEGWPARIAQHEYDHLQGVLYIDVMQSRTFSSSANIGRYWKARDAVRIERILDANTTRRK